MPCCASVRGVSSLPARPLPLLLCLAVAVLGGSVWAQPKPVAIVGAGSAAKGDRDFFAYHVTAQLRVVAHDLGASLDPAEFPKYSIVCWFRGAPDGGQFTPEQIQQVKSYLDNGGRLLVTTGAVHGLFGRPFAATPWLGAATWGYNAKNFPSAPVTPNDPILAGVPVDGAPWLPFAQSFTKPTGVNVLGKAGEWSTLCYNRVGKGVLIYSAYNPYAERPRAHLDAIMAVYRNIVLAANPLTEKEEASALIASAAPNQNVVLWRRDWSGSTEERLLWSPAGPRPEEVLKSLDFATARGEIDTAFFCVQTQGAAQDITARLDPVTGPAGHVETQRLRLLVMGREPEVPVTPPKDYAPVDKSKCGPFYLLPLDRNPSFRLDSIQPATLWVQFDARGLAPGAYKSRLSLLDAQGQPLASLPVKATVEPILMPSPRLVALRTWGGGIGFDPRLAREMARQACDAGVISYPDFAKVRIKGTDVTLLQATRAPQQHLRGKTPLPALDFRDMWNEPLDLYASHGITHLTLKDARSGGLWANAVTGLKCDETKPFEEWPSAWRDAWVNYYRQVTDYLRERGFGMAYPTWTDEPSMATIRSAYLPRAKGYVAAGMGPGSTWTTGGWMSPQMANIFVPWTRCFSMYQYGYPNFVKFMNEGSVKTGEGSIFGFTRGGTGLAVRFPHQSSRIQGWWTIHQGPPASFITTGPIWKGWLYYVDFSGQQWFRLGGVQGERLVAYGASDTKDMSVDMLTSSDWEGARDGVDDANLARMVEWYLPRLLARAEGEWKTRLQVMEVERTLWFKDDSPFPIGETEVNYRHQPKDDDLLEYHITRASAGSTQDIETAKRYMMDTLKEMAPHVRIQDVQARWHEITLVRDGRPAATVVTAPGATDAVKTAAQALAQATKPVPLPVEQAASLDKIQGTILFTGLASDAPAKALGIQLDERYPGREQYIIHRLDNGKGLALLAVDEAGLARGVRAWKAFLNVQGHWLLP